MQTTLVHDPTASNPVSKALMLQEVTVALSHHPKTLPCKYFYDAVGSTLFDSICELPEYYPTRTETKIMREHVEEMMSCVGHGAALIEYGSGSSVKTRILLDHSTDLELYVPVDISGEHLSNTSAGLSKAYPYLKILPITADYTQLFELPDAIQLAARRVIYFPGSTIGNFHKSEAVDFLRLMSKISGKNGGMLIGVDLKKDINVIEAAYNDSAGVTEAFNKNILDRLNKDLKCTFDLAHFRHLAFYNEALGRIEMHLVSTCAQEVWAADYMFKFDEGESIWTESSYKYSPHEFAQIAALGGWNVQSIWTDPNEWFSVQYLTVQ